MFLSTQAVSGNRFDRHEFSRRVCAAIEFSIAFLQPLRNYMEDSHRLQILQRFASFLRFSMRYTT